MQVSLTQNDAKDVQNSWEDIVFGGDLHASETRPKQRHLVDKESLNNFWGGKKRQPRSCFFLSTPFPGEGHRKRRRHHTLPARCDLLASFFLFIFTAQSICGKLKPFKMKIIGL